MRIFISYQTADGAIASRLQRSLRTYGIDSFLAHEDIGVSEVWRNRILDELHNSDACVCLFSVNYITSVWCIQEAGIAAFHRVMTPIPLMLDDTVPTGFLGAIQAKRCNPNFISITDVLPAILRSNRAEGIGITISLIESSGSYRGAEINYEILMPYYEMLTNEQALRLLTVTLNNDQVLHAGRCASEFTPRILRRYGYLLSIEQSQELVDTCNRYGSDIMMDQLTGVGLTN